MIILKIGGSLLENGLKNELVEDIKRTIETDQVVLVHGGGDEVTKIAERLGKRQRFIISPSGIRSRFTDEETIKIYTMVMAGKINKEIVASLLKSRIPCVGLSGIDGTILKAKRKRRLIIKDDQERRRFIEGGYTGKIHTVNKNLIQLLVNNGYVPVISSIAIGEEFELLNIDSDRAAANIAGALEADKALFLTDVQGVLVDGKIVRRLSTQEGEMMLSKIGPGMDKKVMAAIEAINGGVKEVIIAPGRIKNPITEASNHNVGTVIFLE
jgi:acetylglutamate/LysW-gamma-L-alpha-aminoadipate kinase